MLEFISVKELTVPQPCKFYDLIQLTVCYTHSSLFSERRFYYLYIIYLFIWGKFLRITTLARLTMGYVVLAMTKTRDCPPRAHIGHQNVHNFVTSPLFTAFFGKRTLFIRLQARCAGTQFPKPQELEAVLLLLSPCSLITGLPALSGATGTVVHRSTPEECGERGLQCRPYFSHVSRYTALMKRQINV